MLYENTYIPAQVTRVFQIYRLLKALPYYRLSSCAIPLGNSIHILVFGVEEGSLVGRGHIFN
jgi:hypothetical protein